MDLKNQKRLAAELMKCGANRVYIHPDYIEDVGDAITRNDIRLLINAGAIRAKQKAGISRGRTRFQAAQKKAGKRVGPGSRKGAKGARDPKKKRWMRTIRAQRKELKDLRGKGIIEKSTYREFYMRAKGGQFRSRQHLLTHLQIEGYLEEGK
jgi:large subunit ribosomal protein L19e